MEFSLKTPSCQLFQSGSQWFVAHCGARPGHVVRQR